MPLAARPCPLALSLTTSPATLVVEIDSTDVVAMDKQKRSNYWKANIQLLGICLVIWFVCSFGFGVLFVEQLNTIRIGGFQLGFWFAQQGSIYVFVALIFFYAWRMNRLDHEYDVHED